MPSALDVFVAYKFIKQLATPWTKWQAYELGLIDDKGQRLKKTKTPEEKSAYPTWKVLVRNMKRIIDKVPGGKTKFGSFAASLFLLKEEMGIQDVKILEAEFMNYLGKCEILVENESIDKKINTIHKGRYKLQSGTVVHIKETESFDEVLGTPLFFIVDTIKDKPFIVSYDDVTKF